MKQTMPKNLTRYTL